MIHHSDAGQYTSIRFTETLALQGLSAGVGLIVGRAVVRDALDGHDAQKLMS